MNYNQYPFLPSGCGCAMPYQGFCQGFPQMQQMQPMPVPQMPPVQTTIPTTPSQTVQGMNPYLGSYFPGQAPFNQPITIQSMPVNPMNNMSMRKK